jgi:D-lactate dehydrogenase (cytochrome)
MARLGLASELYGYDSYYNNAYAQRGFAFLAGLPWSLHLVVEGADTAEADAALTRLRAIGGRHGREIDGSLPLQARDEPFAKRTRLVNAEGAVWLPTHVLLPYSRARQALQLVDTFLADHVPALHQAGIRTSCLTLAAGANFLLEPSFYWRDQLSPFHRDIMGPDEASQWDALPANPAARQLVIELRQQLSQRLAALGGVHLQLGKYYDYPAMVDPATWTLLGGLKDLLDPRRQMNPGALGLE